MKRPKIVKKPWGKFEEYTHNEKTTVKIISVKRGGILSLQSHKHRKELWVALDEGLTAVVGTKRKKLRKGEMIMVPKKARHRILASRNARFLEISFGNFDENDIKRYEDAYGRA
ncbi:MAG TPA: phosphomannose isomerase type II C-terminal cupin domain [archaeon]|nr:phosphomannose isomerase type II C-terminal cupin domain [archaeon]